MKIGGIVLVWVGIIALLKNMGFIEMIDWNVIWPVLLIITGSVLKHGCRGKCWGKGCGMCGGGKCEGGMMKGMGAAHTCEGPNCKH